MFPAPRILPMTDEVEREQRQAVVAQAYSWIGTPYRQLGARKGAGVDCAMLLVRCMVDAGVYQEFDPRPYPPEWHMHREEERYLEWMSGSAVEVDTPEPGDVAIYRFGKCFSHSAIIVSSSMLVHAYAQLGVCILTERTSTALCVYRNGAPRPVKYFNPWRYMKDMRNP